MSVLIELQCTVCSSKISLFLGKNKTIIGWSLIYTPVATVTGMDAHIHTRAQTLTQ